VATPLGSSGLTSAGYPDGEALRQVTFDGSGTGRARAACFRGPGSVEAESRMTPSCRSAVYLARAEHRQITGIMANLMTCGEVL
jgi:hypothetical protein